MVIQKHACPTFAETDLKIHHHESGFPTLDSCRQKCKIPKECGVYFHIHNVCLLYKPLAAQVCYAGHGHYVASSIEECPEGKMHSC